MPANQRRIEIERGVILKITVSNGKIIIELEESEEILLTQSSDGDLIISKK